MDLALVARILDNLAFRSDELQSRITESERRQMASALESCCASASDDAGGLAQTVVARLRAIDWLAVELDEALAPPPSEERRVRIVVAQPNVDALKTRLVKLIAVIQPPPAPPA